MTKYNRSKEPASSEITSKSDYISRRQFVKAAAAVGGLALLWAGRPKPPGSEVALTESSSATGASTGDAPQIPATSVPTPVTDELGMALTSYKDVTSYNNYYEFTTDKTEVARLASDFQTSPWQVEVGGLVRNPGTYDIDDLRTKFDQEERIYRLRCVEAWSMVIPWLGFPLRKLLAEVEPTDKAKYVRFETLADRSQMPGLSAPWYNWPYVEGLRLDEAMHDLTLLSTGLYGDPLTPQNGAPIRLVVPWKYGFKSIKSIVKIDLVEEMPVSLWMTAGPNEYGFYSNVNPEVDHPRWSQATERRIGSSGRIPTIKFNGYEAEVAHLYAGMDLTENF
ncbi:MAG: protein-methionine-sulfoxide reductase catalytic subunit MsrP [Anaerolineales bacterium]|nr:protein-methionine-sulfoxide reductase catalytic subunit MsrP [Anaerolineales bacterium]